MFLQSRMWYDRYGQQRAEGPYLMAFSWQGSREIRCLVRRVRMSQCGQFMSSDVALLGRTTTLSGAFGSDGLPMDAAGLPAGVWEQLLTAPTDLAEAYWTDSTGHNTVGSTAPHWREWALENKSALGKPLKKR